MDKFRIVGGNKLHGEVTISGAKNAALPLMAATILAPGDHVFINIPRLHDIKTMMQLLEYLGARILWSGNELHINTESIRSDEAPYDLVRKMRASVLVMGPLVARLKHAKVSLPGGCAIGARPIDLHLKALEQMGASVSLHDGSVEINAALLHANTIVFDKVTVTGTENIMMTSIFLKGTTILENAAREPEVTDLANFLNQCGAQIEGAGTSRITIHGVQRDFLVPHSTPYAVMPDRIEAGTFLMAAAITGGELTLCNTPTEALGATIQKLKETGVSVEGDAISLRIRAPERLKAADLKTTPYPGFPTDLQAQFMALMTLAEGSSAITETIFENRFMHVSELNRMGASITAEGRTAIVRGVTHLTGAPVMATDLRASASLVLAALAAQGETWVQRIYHLDRGYEAMEQKLSSVGAEIERVVE